MAGVCSQQLEVERTRWNLLSPGPQLMHQGTILNPCRGALTLVGRGVQIAVMDLTPFFPIQPMGNRQLSVKKLRGKEIPLVKVALNHVGVEEYTWEKESEMRCNTPIFDTVDRTYN
ncbi:hypothetical protein PIB30_082684 [Stylosanthes scabra]|uniref:Uncharacterized protein n=1 Tax=Stylosanthes scabra TaxID=79078 RepID=A0ABU6ZQR2_9FABA|nr:hypothetical protein [Stylosanthes scabra]